MFNLARHPFLEAEILKKKNAIVKYLKNLNLPTWPNSQKGKTKPQPHSILSYTLLLWSICQSPANA